MTLNGSYRYTFCFKIHTSFGAHHENHGLLFLEYKDYADIRGNFLERGIITTVERSKAAIFSAFRRYIFG